MKYILIAVMLCLLSACETVPMSYRIQVESEPTVIYYYNDYPSRRGYHEHYRDCDCEREVYHRRDYYRYYH